MSEFDWPLTIDLSERVEFRVRKASFNDGYTQRAKDGINTKNETWSLLMVPENMAEHMAVRAFLDSHAGLPFEWTPPGGTHPTGWYVCETYDRAPQSYGLWTLSMTFVKDNQP